MYGFIVKSRPERPARPSIVFFGFVNMLDADKFSHLSPETVWQLSDDEWQKSAWHLSISGILSGKTQILKCREGKWFVACADMRDVLALQAPWEIIKRLHQLSELRKLPELQMICAIPPMRFGSLMSMLKCIPYKQMPENIWIELAWKLSVDQTTAQTTKLVSTSDGIYQVRCDSTHAWNELSTPDYTLAMLAWLSSLRKLPEARKIVRLLGDIKPTTQASGA